MQPQLTEQQMSFSTTRTARPHRREEKENLPGENFVRPVFRKSLAPNDIRRPSTRPEATPEAKAADLAGLEHMVRSVLHHVRNPQDFPTELPEEAEHPASTPIFWIAKWLDWSIWCALFCTTCSSP